MTLPAASIDQGPFEGSHRVHLTFSEQRRDYDIVVGEKSLDESGRLILEKIGKRRCLIVSDQNVAALYLQRLESALTKAGLDVLPAIVVAPGESSKSLPIMHELIGHMFERGVDRKTLLIALGGGVVGDLSGFAASIFMRGIDFIQIPTTLLAQVDSSVGGKTGINSPYGKNTVGAFYQPKLVLTDVSTLNTLPSRELLAGYAEVVKCGLIGDVSFFSWCKEHAKALLQGDPALRSQAVCTACAFKAQIVSEDEREGGKRALLNLGHTFAHPLESVMGYNGALLHGEAVAIGTILAFRLSVAMGHCPQADLDETLAHFKAIGLPTAPPERSYDIDELMTLMAQDKKAQNHQLTLILAKGIGRCFVAKDVAPAPVREVWRKAIGL